MQMKKLSLPGILQPKPHWIWLLAMLFTHCKTTPSSSPNMQDSETVTFTTHFSLSSATKDGFYMEGYVVELSDSMANAMDGKNVRVTGKVTVVPGIGSGLNEKGEAVQGRQGDTQRISNPQIEILE